jgi:hypothetical protein
LIGQSRGGGGKEGEGIETDRWGRRVSGRKEKEKGTTGVGCCGEGKGGPLGRKVSEVSFLFSSNSFQINFLHSKSNQTFLNFHRIFIIFLEITQATKRHAKPNNDAQTLVVSKLIKLN